MSVLAYGERALLVEMADHLAALALYEDLRRDPINGVIDLVPAARTLLIIFTDSGSCQAAVAQVAGRQGQPRANVVSTSSTSSTDDPSRANVVSTDDVVEIPVCYDGEDLAAISDRAGRSTAEVIRLHHQADYVVAFIGFAPGFGYLAGLPAALQLPRRDTPRTRVPAGSVAIADLFSAVYPQASPGGWHLLGHTSRQLWDLSRDPPALLSPGTRVRFTPVSG